MEEKDFGKLVATRVWSLVSCSEESLEVGPRWVERSRSGSAVENDEGA